MMRILSCLIRISHCPGLLPAMLAAHPAVDHKYWIVSRRAALRSPALLLYQKIALSFRVFSSSPPTSSCNQQTCYNHPLIKKNAIHSPHIHNCGLRYVGFGRGFIQLKNQYFSCSRCCSVCIPCAGSSRSSRPSSTREYIMINSMASLLTFFPAHRSHCCCS